MGTHYHDFPHGYYGITMAITVLTQCYHGGHGGLLKRPITLLKGVVKGEHSGDRGGTPPTKKFESSDLGQGLSDP